ncbi:MAG: glycosyltransferase family 2 protein [Treponema sp.]|nr:glycosyltransferase family 2 protein [Treponema sp.]
MEALITVMIPCYNAENTINKCLASLFENAVSEKCEFIIVDDCSTDGSVNMIEETVLKYPNLHDNIKVISHKTNMGLAKARNTAFEKASGYYIICVDSDDWVEPDYLSLLYEEARNSNADLICCDYYADTIKGTQRIRAFPGMNSSACLQRLAENKYYGYLWIKWIRRSVLIDNNIKWVEGINLWEDMVISCKILPYIKSISYVNKPLYHYVANPHSLVHTFNQNKAENLIAAVREIERFYAEKNIYEKHADEINCLKIRAKTLISLKLHKNKDFYSKSIKIPSVLFSAIPLRIKLEKFFICDFCVTRCLLSFLYKKARSPIPENSAKDKAGANG